MTSAAPSATAAPPTPAGPRLRIVSVNDVYSLENLPRLATLVREEQTRNPADAFVAILAGDFVAPSMLSSLDRGQGMVECLGAVGITHVIFGNHEDDIPVAELHRRIQEFRGTWLSTNLRDFDPNTRPHDTVEVAHAGGRTVRVGLVGAVMTDPTVYRRPPFGGARLELANASVLREASLLRETERCALVIPVTHQSMADDRALIRAARAASLPLPLIVGGHEHDVHVERDDGTWIVKVGSEAARAGIIEIVWPAAAPSAPGEDLPTVDVRLELVANHEEDREVRAMVERLTQKVEDLEGAILLPLADGEHLSSVGSRARQTSMGTLVCSRVRDVMGAEVCLLNGGGVRAARDYSAHLAYGDIKAELPFDNEMVLVHMPGQVLRDAVSTSRALAPVESGGYLQVDDGVVVDETGRGVVSVAGAPLDLGRAYKVVTVRSFFSGMDHIEPLVAFAKQHPEQIPPATTGRELKEALVEALALALWRKLGGFDALDTDRDGRVSEADVAAALSRLIGQQASPLTVTLVMNAVDKNHDHEISRDEADLVARARAVP
jgi:2',3'-cyclic-nucleotide 2'-phosphodiesterase (5'-nucleotidase family)